MPLKTIHFKLYLPSFPCQRCLLFFKGKGRQASGADPKSLIPFPLPPQDGIPCTGYPFLMSACLLSSSDPVQQHYIVRGEQVPILWKLPFHLVFLTGMSSLLAFFFFWLLQLLKKHCVKPPKSQNVENKQFIIIFSGSKYYCKNNSVWCIHA